jgi:hypothetical protein
MEVLGDDHRVETGRLGLNGLLDQLLGVPLLVTAEVGELGQVSPFSCGAAILPGSLIGDEDGHRLPVDRVGG